MIATDELNTVAAVEARIVDLKTARRRLKDLRAGFRYGTLARERVEIELQSNLSQLGLLYAKRRDLIDEEIALTRRAAAQRAIAAAPARQVPPPPRRSAAAPLPLGPDAHSLSLPAAQVRARHVPDRELVYEVVWTPHRNAPSLIGSYNSRGGARS